MCITLYAHHTLCHHISASSLQICPARRAAFTSSLVPLSPPHSPSFPPPAASTAPEIPPGFTGDPPITQPASSVAAVVAAVVATSAHQESNVDVGTPSHRWYPTLPTSPTTRRHFDLLGDCNGVRGAERDVEGFCARCRSEMGLVSDDEEKDDVDEGRKKRGKKKGRGKRAVEERGKGGNGGRGASLYSAGRVNGGWRGEVRDVLGNRL